MTTPKAVKDIIDAAGGRLVGRTRLQKSAYLLEAAGVGYGFDFSYHYYGPYSEELAIAADDADALGLIDVGSKSTQAGLSYAVYESKGGSPSDMTGRREALLRTLQQYDSVSLELAATAHFLARNGYSDAWGETRRRKTIKATDERIAKAQHLLAEIDV